MPGTTVATIPQTPQIDLASLRYPGVPTDTKTTEEKSISCKNIQLWTVKPRPFQQYVKCPQQTPYDVQENSA